MPWQGPAGSQPSTTSTHLSYTPGRFKIFFAPFTLSAYTGFIPDPNLWGPQNSANGNEHGSACMSVRERDSHASVSVQPWIVYNCLLSPQTILLAPPRHFTISYTVQIMFFMSKKVWNLFILDKDGSAMLKSGFWEMRMIIHTQLGLCALPSMTKLMKMTTPPSTFKPQNTGQVIIRFKFVTHRN